MSSSGKSEKVVIISGPSGAGKSTVVRRLIDDCPLPLTLSVSATTRQPRSGERDGVDYHFLTHAEFRDRQEAGEFLEAKEVFKTGDWYGTLRSQVTAGLNEGKWVILEIDVEGMSSVLERIPDAMTVFIHPGSLAELETRLRNRRTDSEESIQRRLQVAERELDRVGDYQHKVVNRTGDPDSAVQDICQILSQAEKMRCSRT